MRATKKAPARRQLETFACVLRHPPSMAAVQDWRQLALDVVAKSNGQVRPSGELEMEGELVGFARLTELEQIAYPLPGLRSECPWVGEPLGVLEWTHCVSVDLAVNKLVEPLIQQRHGPFVRIDSSESRESVFERAFPMRQLTSKYGFESGAALLDREPGPYLSDAIQRARRVCADAGIAWTAHFDDRRIGNPLRAGPLSDEARESALEGHRVRLWSYNWDLLREAGFWWE